MALRHTAEISYYVATAHHRQGAVSCLVDQALGDCGRLQFGSLFAMLIDANGTTANVLLKRGFSKWGHMPKVLDFDDMEYGH